MKLLMLNIEFSWKKTGQEAEQIAQDGLGL